MRKLLPQWRLLMLVLALISIGVFLTSSYFGWSRSLAVQYDRLQEGMTEREVFSIIAKKTNYEWADRSNETAGAFWDDGWNEVEVRFRQGRLSWKRIKISSEPTQLRRARDRAIKAVYGKPPPKRSDK
jgi:hypothetical protein